MSACAFVTVAHQSSKKGAWGFFKLTRGPQSTMPWWVREAMSHFRMHLCSTTLQGCSVRPIVPFVQKARLLWSELAGHDDRGRLGQGPWPEPGKAVGKAVFFMPDQVSALHMSKWTHFKKGLLESQMRDEKRLSIVTRVLRLREELMVRSTNILLSTSLGQEAKDWAMFALLGGL